jgi:flagellum-specific ATP synthase
MTLLAGAIERMCTCEPIAVRGEVASLRGMTLLVADLPVVVGSIVRVEAAGGERLGEVIGFDGGYAIVMMLGHIAGVRSGDHVWSHESSPTVAVGASMLGRVIDGLGRPIDDGPPLRELSPALVHPEPSGPLHRRPIREPLATSVRAIDTMTTVGRGQRLGIFAGPGVGKSTLLSMIARNTSADVNVIALIGERGREVRDFIENALGSDGLARSVLVVSTSDESPLMRVRAAFVACAVAEHFRDRGSDVMLMVDSVTRFAHAQRQIGLAVGEPPATKGYTPSVFAMLPRLLERAGAFDAASGRGGSVTGFYTVLVEGDDMTEPVADAVRGILDGHVMLSRTLAQRGHFPAIDVLDSVSRLADDVCTAEHIAARRELGRLLAAHRSVEELLQIGAYASGSNPLADRAIALKEHIDTLLCQPSDVSTPMEESVAALRALVQAR